MNKKTDFFVPLQQFLLSMHSLHIVLFFSWDMSHKFIGIEFILHWSADLIWSKLKSMIHTGQRTTSSLNVWGSIYSTAIFKTLASNKRNISPWQKHDDLQRTIAPKIKQPTKITEMCSSEERPETAAVQRSLCTESTRGPLQLNRSFHCADKQQFP